MALPPAESGNEAFFQLGVDLRSAGLSMAEIEIDAPAGSWPCPPSD